MSKLVLDNLDQSMLDELQRRAAEHGWSVKEEARYILASVTGLPPADENRRERMREFRKRAEAFRQQFGSRVTSDIVALIREDRDR